MLEKVAVIYNDPELRNYNAIDEDIPLNDILTTVGSVAKALDTLGYEYSCIPLCSPLKSVEKEISEINADIVFNLFEGFDGCTGSEAAVAAMLERLGLCFTGASSRALHLCGKKSQVKQVLEANKIPIPNWQVLSPTTYDNFNLEFPCIVKPLYEHGSNGLTENSVVNDNSSLREQVNYIWQTYKHPSLVEKFLPGRELRILIIGNGYPIIYPAEEIIYTLPVNKPRLLTYSAKWMPDDEYYKGSCEKCPADIAPELQQLINTMALRSYTALYCHGYASIDMRQDEHDQFMVIDVNPNTDIYAGGCVKLPLEASRIEYSTFINEILSIAKEFHVIQTREEHCLALESAISI
jgi:D-alanine-D-alanine ligase